MRQTYTCLGRWHLRYYHTCACSNTYFSYLGQFAALLPLRGGSRSVAIALLVRSFPVNESYGAIYVTLDLRLGGFYPRLLLTT